MDLFPPLGLTRRFFGVVAEGREAAVEDAAANWEFFVDRLVEDASAFWEVFEVRFCFFGGMV